jgi:uncharacterized protein
VIGLPSNLFFGTGIPAAILIFKREKTDQNVIFIGANRPAGTINTMSAAAATILEQQGDLERLCERHHVARLTLFGSANRNDFNPNSDLDFLVEFKPLTPEEYAPNYFDFVAALEHLFTRPVDVISGTITNPFVRQSIERDQRIVYAVA